MMTGVTIVFFCIHRGQSNEMSLWGEPKDKDVTLIRKFTLGHLGVRDFARKNIYSAVR